VHLSSIAGQRLRCDLGTLDGECRSDGIVAIFTSIHLVALPHADEPKSALDRWLGGTDAGIGLCTRWRVWIAQQVARYEWEIDAATVKGPTIHGPRGTGVLGRWTKGFNVNQIANDVGMSRQTDEYYMRFKDRRASLSTGGPGSSLSQSGTRPQFLTALYHPLRRPDL
jgi:hypothetical protein